MFLAVAVPFGCANRTRRARSPAALAGRLRAFRPLSDDLSVFGDDELSEPAYAGRSKTAIADWQVGPHLQGVGLSRGLANVSKRLKQWPGGWSSRYVHRRTTKR